MILSQRICNVFVLFDIISVLFFTFRTASRCFLVSRDLTNEEEKRFAVSVKPWSCSDASCHLSSSLSSLESTRCNWFGLIRGRTSSSWRLLVEHRFGQIAHEARARRDFSSAWLFTNFTTNYSTWLRSRLCDSAKILVSLVASMIGHWLFNACIDCAVKAPIGCWWLRCYCYWRCLGHVQFYLRGAPRGL